SFCHLLVHGLCGFCRSDLLVATGRSLLQKKSGLQSRSMPKAHAALIHSDKDVLWQFNASGIRRA
ncbi:MAG: hypothetical protein OXU23_05770, partial [Candidatus Poribacteria bacterium]|nr:hypothetical protein [Candidatus Poribacteria bacterium]